MDEAERTWNCKCPALLSLAYLLLFTQVYAAVECAGLEPYQGFFHGEK